MNHGHGCSVTSAYLLILETEQQFCCLWCERVCKQVLVANCKLGRDKTKLSSHHISRLDKTVSKFSVADSLDLSLILFTLPTRLSCLVFFVVRRLRLLCLCGAINNRRVDRVCVSVYCGLSLIRPLGIVY